MCVHSILKLPKLHVAKVFEVGAQGVTYYDWTQQAMIEERYDYCVNIFPEGNMYPCTFFNTNNISYLIRNNRHVQVH